MSKGACIFFILFMSFFSYSQSEKEYFKDFKKVDYLKRTNASDSIPFYYNIEKKQINKDSISCYLFKMKFPSEKPLTFWLGIKDSTYYTFKNNDLNKPKILTDFKEEQVKSRKVCFHPLSNDFKTYVSKIMFINNKHKNDVVVFLDMRTNKRKSNHPIIGAILSLKEGLYFSFGERIWNEWYMPTH